MSNGIYKGGMNRKIVIGFIGVALVLLVLGAIQPVSATWTKKAPIHINNTGGSALTDYQVMLNITYDSDMQADFDDIRVKNETSGEFVPYWIENKSDGSWCKLWFNATYIPANSWCNDTYYLLYGDASASSESNITSTFIFADDFENETISFGSSGKDWTRHSSNPILPLGSDWKYGKCDACVVKNGSTYVMLFTGVTSSQDHDRKIGRATSSDPWSSSWTEDADPVIPRGSEGEWDYWGVDAASILVDIDTGEPVYEDGKYWIYYVGKDENGNTQVGIAYTTDLASGNYTKDTEHSPCFNLTPYGGVWGISVVKDGNEYKLYFDDSPNNIRLATSTDKFNFSGDTIVFQKNASIDWEKDGIGYVNVVKRNSTYYLFYAGWVDAANDIEQIGLASSSDGTNFTRESNEPWFPKGSSGWDNHAVSDHCVCRFGDYDYIYYAGESDSQTNEQIGVARIDDFRTYGEGATTEGKWIKLVNPEISSDQAKEGLYSVKFRSSNGDGLRRNFTHSNDYVIEYWGYVPSQPYRYYLLHWGDGSYKVEVALKEGNEICYYTTAWQGTGHTITYGEWFKIGFRNFDWSAHTFDILLNDEVIKSGAGMVSSAGQEDKIEFGGISDNTVDLYADVFRIRKYADPEPTALLGAEQNVGGYEPYTITLQPGWNLIGWTDPTPKSAHSVGLEIGSNCTYIVERNRTTGLYVSHNMAGPEDENNFMLERGWGYYVRVSAETKWNRSA